MFGTFFLLSLYKLYMYRSEKLLVRLLNTTNDPTYGSAKQGTEDPTAQIPQSEQSAQSKPTPELGDSCTYRMKEANELFFNYVFKSSQFYGLFPINDPNTTTIVMGDFNDHSRFLYRNEHEGKSSDGIASLITDGFTIGDTEFPGHKQVFSKPMDSLVDTEAAPTCCRFAKNGTFRSQSDAIFVNSPEESKSDTKMRVHGILGERDEFPSSTSEAAKDNELTKLGFELPNLKVNSKLYKKPDLQYDPTFKTSQPSGTVWYKILTKPSGTDISGTDLGAKLKRALEEGVRKFKDIDSSYGIQSSDLNGLNPTDYIASSSEEGVYYVANTDSYNHDLIKAMNKHIENYYSTERMRARPLDLISDHLKVSIIRDKILIVSVNISSVLLMMYTKAYNELEIKDPTQFPQAVVQEYVSRGGFLGTESIAAMFLITKGRDFMKELYKHVADHAHDNGLDFLIGVQEATLDYFKWFVSTPLDPQNKTRLAPTVMYTQSGPEGSALIFGGDKFVVPANSQFTKSDTENLYVANYDKDCWNKPLGRKWKPKEGSMSKDAKILANDKLKDIIQSKIDAGQSSVTLSVGEFESLKLPSETKITTETMVELGEGNFYVPDSFTWQENIRDDPWTVWNGGRTVLITPLIRQSDRRHLNVLNVHSFNPSSDAAKRKYGEIEEFAKTEPPRDRQMEFDMFD